MKINYGGLVIQDNKNEIKFDIILLKSIPFDVALLSRNNSDLNYPSEMNLK